MEGNSSLQGACGVLSLPSATPLLPSVRVTGTARDGVDEEEEEDEDEEDDAGDEDDGGEDTNEANLAGVAYNKWVNHCKVQGGTGGRGARNH